MKSIILFMILKFSFTNAFSFDEIPSQALISKKNLILIDVREIDELKSGKISGAYSIPLSSFEKNPVETIRKLKNLSNSKEIYLYCRSGRRSGVVKNMLSKNGVVAKNIGGYDDLIRKGLSTEYDN